MYGCFIILFPNLGCPPLGSRSLEAVSPMDKTIMACASMTSCVVGKAEAIQIDNTLHFEFEAQFTAFQIRRI
jgi:hypothetical protein